ncbi:uncharacterized protein V1516DRAFT_670676 [Lipomyces oligophaga]|uniref:uncharacterized protein n=1 Tax=Lipomyces oligophaga TaxID=45792 RepID=UPI0034CD9C3F
MIFDNLRKKKGPSGTVVNTGQSNHSSEFFGSDNSVSGSSQLAKKGGKSGPVPLLKAPVVPTAGSQGSISDSSRKVTEHGDYGDRSRSTTHLTQVSGELTYAQLEAEIQNKHNQVDSLTEQILQLEEENSRLQQEAEEHELQKKEYNKSVIQFNETLDSLENARQEDSERIKALNLTIENQALRQRNLYRRGAKTGKDNGFYAHHFSALAETLKYMCVSRKSGFQPTDFQRFPEKYIHLSENVSKIRCYLSEWLFQEVFGKYFSTCVDPNLSIILKTMQIHIEAQQTRLGLDLDSGPWRILTANACYSLGHTWSQSVVNPPNWDSEGDMETSLYFVQHKQLITQSFLDWFAPYFEPNWFDDQSHIPPTLDSLIIESLKLINFISEDARKIVLQDWPPASAYSSSFMTAKEEKKSEPVSLVEGAAIGGAEFFTIIGYNNNLEPSLIFSPNVYAFKVTE